jgi:hypothetical protein
MKLRSLKISGFMGFSPEQPIELQDFGRINVLAGPNNSGKSSVFSFLRKITAVAGGIDIKKIKEPGGTSFDVQEHMHWQRDRNVQIEGMLTFSDSKLLSNMPTEFREQSDHCGVHVQMTKLNGPAEVDWFPLSANMKAKAHPVTSGIVESHKWLIKETLHDWAKKTRFFDPVRSLTKPGTGGLLDGSSLVKDFYQRSLNTSDTLAYEKLIESLKNLLNSLIGFSGTPLITSLELKGSAERPKLMIKAGQNLVPIDSMGTGISQIIILGACLALDTSGSYAYFIEEPETHLHPGLLKRLIFELRKYSNSQFFISTHSSAILDCLTDDDRVYLLRQATNGACTVRRCIEFTEHQDLLDSLGISARDTLQTNCTIWVEGPTDRIYLRQWLEDHATSAGELLVEGCDYSIVSYGGKLLSHFGFAQSVDDVIEVVKINRYSAFLMDKDLPPNQGTDNLNETKKEILKAAEADSVHFYAATTDGREIENDIPPELLFLSIARTLGRDESEFSKCMITGELKFAKEIAQQLNFDEKQRDKINDSKLTIARDVVQMARLRGSFGQPPSYIKPLFELILRSRRPDFVSAKPVA